MKELIVNIILPGIFYILVGIIVMFLFASAFFSCNSGMAEKCYKIVGSKCVNDVCNVYINNSAKWEEIRIFEKAKYGDQLCRNEVVNGKK